MAHQHKADHGAETPLLIDDSHAADAHHHVETHTHDSASGHEHSASHSNLSFEDRVLLKTRELVKPMLPKGHGHHAHHHHHVQYKAPQSLTDALALYSIRKLSLLDHHFPVKDARIINPVTPGLLSWVGVIGLTSSAALWGMYVFRTTGIKGFAGKGGVVFAGLAATTWVGIRVIDEMREMTMAGSRKRLAQKYRQKLGDAYLLNVLNPAFKLDHHH